VGADHRLNRLHAAAHAPESLVLPALRADYAVGTTELSLRISDSDRAAAAARLRDACAEGRITADELADRLELVFAARTEADLAPVLDDLPARAPAAVAERRGFAPWWRRAAAFFVDSVAIGAGSALVGLAGIPLVGYGLGVAFASPLLTLAYFTLQHGSRRGQTLGDHAFGIAVRNNADAARVTYGQAFGRTFMVMLFAAFWALGGFADFLWPLWDRKRQAWHDKVAGTIVVRVSDRR
jgi:uncharacterized RDD family membrane protein YckC